MRAAGNALRSVNSSVMPSGAEAFYPASLPSAAIDTMTLQMTSFHGWTRATGLELSSISIEPVSRWASTRSLRSALHTDIEEARASDKLVEAVSTRRSGWPARRGKIRAKERVFLNPFGHHLPFQLLARSSGVRHPARVTQAKASASSLWNWTSSISGRPSTSSIPIVLLYKGAPARQFVRSR